MGWSSDSQEHRVEIGFAHPDNEDLNPCRMNPKRAVHVGCLNGSNKSSCPRITAPTIKKAGGHDRPVRNATARSHPSCDGRWCCRHLPGGDDTSSFNEL